MLKVFTNLGRQVPGHGKSHANDGTLGSRVCRLPDLPVEGSHGGGVDDHAALSVKVGLVLAHQPDRQPVEATGKKLMTIT